MRFSQEQFRERLLGCLKAFFFERVSLPLNVLAAHRNILLWSQQNGECICEILGE